MAHSSLIACVGDNCLDMVLTPGSVADAMAGGNAFNVAVALAQAERHAAYLGAIGDDEAGKLIAGAAAAAGVDITRLVTLSGHTGRTIVDHDHRGERQFVSEDYGASAEYRLDAETAGWLADADWVHFARQPDLAEWQHELRDRGAVISCDLGYENGLGELERVAPAIDVAFLSASAAGGLAEEALIDRALAAGIRLVVLTCGAAGSIAATADARWSVEAVPVPEVVDTLGAGDAYIAAFIAARADREDIPAAMRAGSRAGAAACAQWGPISATRTGRIPV